MCTVKYKKISRHKEAGLFPYFVCQVEDQDGNFQRAWGLIDTGADFTLIPANFFGGNWKKTLVKKENGVKYYDYFPSLNGDISGKLRFKPVGKICFSGATNEKEVLIVPCFYLKIKVLGEENLYYQLKSRGSEQILVGVYPGDKVLLGKDLINEYLLDFDPQRLLMRLTRLTRIHPELLAS